MPPHVNSQNNILLRQAYAKVILPHLQDNSIKVWTDEAYWHSETTRLMTWGKRSGPLDITCNPPFEVIQLFLALTNKGDIYWAFGKGKFTQTAHINFMVKLWRRLKYKYRFFNNRGWIYHDAPQNKALSAMNLGNYLGFR
jgi:hypothetical protein